MSYTTSKLFVFVFVIWITYRCHRWFKILWKKTFEISVYKPTALQTHPIYPIAGLTSTSAILTTGKERTHSTSTLDLTNIGSSVTLSLVAVGAGRRRTGLSHSHQDNISRWSSSVCTTNTRSVSRGSLWVYTHAGEIPRGNFPGPVEEMVDCSAKFGALPHSTYRTHVNAFLTPVEQHFGETLTHWGRYKWQTFRRRHFQMHLREWRYVNFDWHFTEVCS